MFYNPKRKHVGNGFPIVPSKTNFAKLLGSGPVTIGGASRHTPAQWLLATGLSPDGRSILCNDPVTGRVVALSLDRAMARYRRLNVVGCATLLSTADGYRVPFCPVLQVVISDAGSRAL